MKVLIVDDSEVVRGRLKEALSEVEGVVIAGEAAGAAAAVRLALEVAPCLVTLDIRMEDGSGIDVLKHIKAHAPKTVVLMFTNFAGEQYRKACMQAGADFFCDKSMDYHHVVRICRELQDGWC